jgi:hypothetical protein
MSFSLLPEFEIRALVNRRRDVKPDNQIAIEPDDELNDGDDAIVPQRADVPNLIF